METLKKLNTKLLRIEKTLKKYEKTFDFRAEDIEKIEQDLNYLFGQLEDREAFYLRLDMHSEINKKELIETVNCINLCDSLWHRLISLQERDLDDSEDIDEEGYKREVWDMMYPDEDINSDSFEINDFEE